MLDRLGMLGKKGMVDMWDILGKGGDQKKMSLLVVFYY